MKKEEYFIRQMGENLDALMNIDPTCIGINRLCYPGVRDYAGGPTAMHFAQELSKVLKPEDVVLILCGFVLRNHQRTEMDGFTGALLTARALVEGFDVKPVIVIPQESQQALKNCAAVVGLNYYDSLDLVLERPFAMTGVVIPKDAKAAEECADKILAFNPRALISMETASPNEKGVYHMAYGWDVTKIEAKMDVLFNKVKERAIPTFSIGDCGNELGMGAIKNYIQEHVPGAGEGGCICECKGGAAAATAADHIIIAKTADWGCYAMIAALAYLKKNMKIMHDANLQADLMKAAAYHGMLTTNGSLTPAIDGFSVKFNATLIDLMRQCVEIGVTSEDAMWIDKFTKTGFFTE
ncbi:glutamate cyclase domain-containing protein [Desulfitobacterium hafniense]|nr:glutamate cyclase domain-containing protein [Desulfitobacterium hafniense]KTE92822.1 hypothetical protein AT727_17595 [Desulfitobacterium hafniense]MEA5023381.1 DUF4392 domain-containing protein [Desulfitobacterium hafniense]